MARDEIVTIEGVVFDGGNPWPYVNATIKLADVTSAFAARHNFQIVQADKSAVWIELAKNPVLEPQRSVSGPWSELEHHGSQPPSLDLAPDRAVTIAGEWIEGGEPITVIGYAKSYELVADTGGYREAPQRRPSLVRAIAIGVGANAGERAKKAFARREDAIEERSRPVRPANTTVWAWVIICCFVAAVVFYLTR